MLWGVAKFYQNNKKLHTSWWEENFFGGGEELKFSVGGGEYFLWWLGWNWYVNVQLSGESAHPTVGNTVSILGNELNYYRFMQLDECCLTYSTSFLSSNNCRVKVFVSFSFSTLNAENILYINRFWILLRTVLYIVTLFYIRTWASNWPKIQEQKNFVTQRTCASNWPKIQEQKNFFTHAVLIFVQLCEKINDVTSNMFYSMFQSLPQGRQKC